jgi:hypothetical protein
MARLDQEVAAAEGTDGHAPSKPAGAPAPQSPPLSASDPAARAAAIRWFTALASGDGPSLTNLCALPFKTSGKEVAQRAALSSMLSDLAQEGAGGRLDDVQVHTTASLRAAIGKLPPNLDEGAGGQLYAISDASARDVLILILGQRAGRWQAVGLIRR